MSKLQALETSRPGGRGIPSRGGFWKDPGDDRLSRQRHYHGPGGLNGRVRNGNGCGPAGMVAGNAARPAVRPARATDRGGSGHVPPEGRKASDQTSFVAWCGIVVPGLSATCRGASGDRDRQGGRHGVRCRDGTVKLSDSTAGPGLRRGDGRRVGVVKRSAVGTGPLRRSPAVHSQPIDLVVFQEPSHYTCRKPRLEEGFALRCLQRLSFPDLATRRCPERDSRHTRGRSSPILSY